MMSFLKKTVAIIVTILTKCFFPYLNPTSYLKETNWLISKECVFSFLMLLVNVL